MMHRRFNFTTISSSTSSMVTKTAAWRIHRHNGHVMPFGPKFLSSNLSVCFPHEHRAAALFPGQSYFFFVIHAHKSWLTSPHHFTAIPVITKRGMTKTDDQWEYSPSSAFWDDDHLNTGNHNILTRFAIPAIRLQSWIHLYPIAGFPDFSQYAKKSSKSCGSPENSWLILSTQTVFGAVLLRLLVAIPSFTCIVGIFDI